MKKRICHVVLNGTFNDGWNYQENILPKYHMRMGYDVCILATPYCFDDGIIVKGPEKSFVNNDGISIHVLRCVNYKLFGGLFKKFPNLIAELNIIKPDILFVHDCQFVDIKKIAKFLKINPQIRCYVDNHADFSNSATSFLSKNILHRIIWKKAVKKVIPYVQKFYGVLPARVDFLKQMYDIPDEKCELLVMGADDELVKKSASKESKERTLKKYGLLQDGFIIVTGGKIDSWKKETLDLIKAIKDISIDGIVLLVFGTIASDIKKDFDELIDGRKCKYIGWLNSTEIYDLFAISDLAVFPGRHSVLWEQAAGQGVPLICKRIYGTDHIDVGGNVIFLENSTEKEIMEKIEYVINDRSTYQRMVSISKEKAIPMFAYSKIAERSIMENEK